MLKNIGIIKDSTIELNGLTVITGRNNSGKTTVGKVLFSLIDAVSDIEKKLEADRQDYILRNLYEILRELDIFGFVSIFSELDNENSDIQDSALKKLFSVRRRAYNYDEKYLEKLLAEIRSLDVDFYYKKIVSSRHDDKSKKREIVFRPVINQELLSQHKENAILKIENLLRRMAEGSEINNYALERINLTLNEEFSNQIQPVIQKTEISKIKLLEKGNVYFDLKIQDNTVVKNEEIDYSLFMNTFQNIYLIDDPFIVDEWRYYTGNIRYYNLEEDNDTIINIANITAHREQLKRVLFSQRKQSVLETIINKKELDVICNILYDVLPGKFGMSEKQFSFMTDTYKLNVNNLAAGTKLFAIIKILVEKGKIDKNTLLIFDEPESHLHPEWQNIFAEVIVLLVKLLNVTIVLTTHSSNFMLAIDAFMRKHEIENKTNFYQTYFDKNNMVHHECVNENLEKIYGDFVKYFSKMKALRDSYMDFYDAVQGNYEQEND